MPKKFFSSMEELEVEKVYDEEHTSNNSSETDDMETIIKNNIDDSKKEDMDSDKNTPDADDSATEDDISRAMESYHEAIQVSMAIEDLSVASEEIPEFITNGAKVAGNVALDAAVFLKDIGFKYAPPLIKAVGKATLFSIEKTLKGLFYGTKALIRISEKSIHSYKSFDSKGEKLKKSIALLKAAKKTTVTTGKKYAKEKTIANMSIDSHTKPLETIKVYSEFMSKYVLGASGRIDSSVTSIKLLIGRAGYGGIKQPTKYIGEEKAIVGLSKRTISGYDPDSNNVDSYVYPKVLPGNTLLIAYVPKKDLVDMSDVYDAYTNSQIFLGKSFHGSNIPQTINYMSLSEVESLLKEIQSMCAMGTQYVATFKHIEKQRNSIKYSLKGLLNILARNTDKVKIDKSVTEAIYLKNMFIDKCFIGSMQDIEYNTRMTIRSYLDYCQDNLIELSKSK